MKSYKRWTLGITARTNHQDLSGDPVQAQSWIRIRETGSKHFLTNFWIFFAGGRKGVTVHWSSRPK